MTRRFTKILAAIALLVFMTPSLVAWGQTRTEVTYTFSDHYSSNTVLDGVDIALDNVVHATFNKRDGGTATQYYTNGTAVRWYGGGTLAIVASNATISNIEITYTQTANSVSASVGSYSLSNSVGTWSGSTSSVTFTQSGTSGHCRISAIKVTYSAGGSSAVATTVTIDATGITNTDVYTSTVAGSLSASVSANGEPIEGATVTWSGDNDAVATINASTGVVTLISMGVVTFTASYAGVENVYLPSSNTYEMTVVDSRYDVSTLEFTAACGGSGTADDGAEWTVTSDGTESIFDATYGIHYGTNSASVTYVQLATSDINGQVAKVVVNARDAQATATITVTVGGTSFTCTGSATATNTSADYTFVGTGTGEIVVRIDRGEAMTKAIYVKRVVVVYEPDNTPSFTITNNNELDYDATEGSFNFTVNHAVTGGVTTVEEDVDWISNAVVSGNAVTFTTTANDAAASREGVITLTYTYSRETITENVTVSQAADPNATMTIAEVRALNTGTTVATKGVVTSISVSGNNKTAYFQDNTAGIVAFGPFTTEVAVGDEIRVEGELTVYHGLLEIGKNNAAPTVTVLSQNNTVTPVLKTIAEISNGIQAQLVKVEDATVTVIDGQNTTIAQGQNTIVVRGISGVEYAVNDVLTLTANVGCYDNPQLVNPQNVEVHAVPSITIESNAFELTANEEEGYLDITYDNFNPISFDIMFCDTNGNELSEDPDWIMLAIEAPEGEEGDFVYYVADANDGEARTAYFKVYASLGEGQETVYSNLVTVTQAAPVVDYATLPFNWEGGTSAALDALNGVTVECDPSDYAESNAPYRVKFNDDGHYILIKTNDQPAVVSVGIKKFANGNNSSLVIQGSSDGVSFTDVQTFSITGNQNATFTYVTTNAFSATDRYVRIYFNKPSSGGSNIGVGPITISGLETYPLTINAHTANGGWYLIASPVAVNPANVEGMTIENSEASNYSNFDLYYFDQTGGQNGKEWKNYKANHFDLELGKGYLYANANTVDLTFTGVMNGDFINVNLPYVQDNTIQSLYLAGNSKTTTETFYVYDNNWAKQTVNFLTINGNGDGFTTTTTNSFTAQALQGFFVQSGGASWTLSTADMEAKSENTELLNVMVSQNHGILVDNAIVSFSNTPLLNKLYLSNNSTRVFIPQNGEEMAVVRSEAQGEMPVNFKANENGIYTLSINPEGVEMNYLHLIDNKTGNDVDLLQTPSYSFEAKTTDYESRFKLVFVANNEDSVSTGSETFAFFSNGSFVINNEGNAELQVIDITGRIVKSESINGCANVSVNAAPGVYMIRLINGDNVKTQKVVVR